MKDLVSLLGGRDFETREYKEEIAESSFALLKEGVLDFMNLYSFSNFLLAIKSAGFISPKLINSDMTLDFAYTLFLLLHADPNVDKKQIDKYVKVVCSIYAYKPLYRLSRDGDGRRFKEYQDKGF